MPTISRRVFSDAFVNGDLSTIQADFAQPDVHARVLETNEYIATHRPGTRLFDRHYRSAIGRIPWFIAPRRVPDRIAFVHLFYVLAARGHTHIVEWFLAPERLETMGATLAYLLPNLLVFVSLQRSSDPHMVEIVLTSHVFLEWLSPEKQHDMLQSLVISNNPDVVAIAIAHGANLDSETTLQSFAWNVQDPLIVDLVVRNGAFVVGANVLDYVARGYNEDVAECFVLHGADWGYGAAAPALHMAAEKLTRPNFVRVYVEMGFVDVDACGEDGVTLLMRVVENDKHRQDGQTFHEVAEMLLAYGADVQRRDAVGHTALDHAITAENDAMIDLLRAHGAYVRLW